MVGAGLLARNAVERGPDAQALGEDLAGAGLDRGHRLPRASRPDRVPRRAPVQPGRLRLHHLHRQLRPAAAGDLGRGRGEGPGGLRGALRQPQLRGPDQPGREGELPGQPAAGRRLRAGRADGHRPRPASRSARAPTASRSTCATSGPSAEEIKEVVGALDRLGDVHPQLRRGASRATRTGTRSRCPRATATPGPTRPTCASPSLLRGDAGRAARGRADRRRPGAGPARRLDHHRPHLARRGDQEGQPGRAAG